ncbi:MAG: hypothetical protein KGJ36_01710 [Acidobacteriota bacterium]|nr:hypothetical protein [Acidobacteriota bacterium]
MRRWVVVGAVLGLALAAPAGASRNPGLPNPALTPGALNPRVTQSTLHSTICVPGYSSSVRPSESYTEALKFRQLDGGYNLNGDTRARDYEEDHLIPLELGGSPTSVWNLWPEPWRVTWNAGRKDALENTLHRLVCAGVVSLASARHVVATNWIAGYQRYVG